QYDALGRVIYAETPGYQNKLVAKSTVYDAAGRIKRDMYPHLAGTIEVGEIDYTYDVLGRVIKTQRVDEAGPAVTRYRYGTPSELPSSPTFRDDVRANAIFATAVTDPLGRIDMAAFDRQGRTVASQDAAGAAAQYTYGAFGGMLRANDPAGNTTTW